ncbi:Nucleoporin NSP1 [Candida viswanathii]|uniref:Nucleoporin NSP1 n=1 Tax=Candida viswanathii TaxID=5486 RepID=A0A367XM30_9ASCO|nr:Nucleoporin NSP1 [Candida viswanathii]
MTTQRKRSVSPNTETSFVNNSSEEPTRPTLSSYFSKFKQSFISPSPSTDTATNEAQDKQQQPPVDLNIDDQSLANFRPSDKRRRLSIQSHPSPQGIPRSSAAFSTQFLPRQRSYLIMYNDVKTNEEELNNDLEVRVTAKESQSMDDRDESPFVDLPQAPNAGIILGGGRAGSVGETSDGEAQDGVDIEVDEEQIQEVVEYAPLYQDESGNIVRPPFINLDPRERYQLLQLKRSIETSEALQQRIKYMVNPNETFSRRLNGTNKVETSTQTHDLGYLNSRLNFKRKLEPQSYIQQRPAKKQKRKGFAMENFEYDVKSEEPVVTTSSLNGVLGAVSKPKFKDHSKAEDKNITHIIPREDEEPISKKFSQQGAASANRDLFGRQDTSQLKLDENYIKQSDSISDIIKLKDNLGDHDKAKKVSAGPSSGFKFNINKDDFKEVIDARKQNDEMLEKAKAPKSDLFQKPVESKVTSADSKPKLLFGLPNNESSLKQNEEKKEAPKFSFGNKPAEPKEVPKFTLSKTTTPEAPKEQSEEPKKTSLFSFGKTDEKKDDSPKPSLFGDKKDTDQPPKPLFSFGAKKDSAPAFSLGGKKESTPASLDDNKDAPTVSFSFTAKKDDEKPKQDEPKPLFLLSGVTSKDSTPSTPNTASTTPFLFGGAPKDDKKEEAPKTGLFGFGQNNVSAGTSTTGTFKFVPGEEKPSKRPQEDEEEKKDKPEEQQPATKKVNFNTPTPQPTLFSFGSATSSTSKPAFNLGAATIEKKDTTPGALSVATSTSTPAPVTAPPTSGTFSFTSASKPTPPASGNPSFKFASGVTPPAGVKPQFNFSGPTGSSAPAFGGFGQPTTSLGGATNPPPFGQSGTFGQASQGAGSGGFGQSPASGTTTSGGAFGQANNIFGSKSAPSTTPAPGNVFGSRPTTPTFNFTGGSNAPANANANPPLPAPMPSGVPLFNFTGSKESTPDPASIFGQHNANRSATSTPFGNTMNNTMFGQQPQQPQQQPNMFGGNANAPNTSFAFGGGTGGGPVVNGGVPTPVVNPRRIIQPRSRRR